MVARGGRVWGRRPSAASVWGSSGATNAASRLGGLMVSRPQQVSIVGEARVHNLFWSARSESGTTSRPVVQGGNNPKCFTFVLVGPTSLLIALSH